MFKQDKKELLFVLGSTGNMAFATANVIMSIVENCTLEYDILVYENNFEENDKKLINQIHKTKFINYEFPNDCKLNEATIKQFTKLAFSRYECFSLLKDYKKVMWIDIDTLVNKNLDNFIKNFEDEMGILCSHNKVIDNFINPIENYDMTKDSCNSGVFIITDKIVASKKLTEYCYKKTYELAENLKCADQGIICLLIEDFKLKIKDLGELFNCHPISKRAKEAYILHTFRPEKFWNFYSNKKWNENNKKWLKMGGSKYNGKKASLYQKIWKTFFYEYPDPIRYPKGFFRKLFKRG